MKPRDTWHFVIFMGLDFCHKHFECENNYAFKTLTLCPTVAVTADKFLCTNDHSHFVPGDKFFIRSLINRNLSADTVTVVERVFYSVLRAQLFLHSK